MTDQAASPLQQWLDWLGEVFDTAADPPTGAYCPDCKRDVEIRWSLPAVRYGNQDLTHVCACGRRFTIDGYNTPWTP